jgi:nitroimidazol reductase NimA-like FMN-containing flavoprotein (pyridoxamine 5'-phosphate oxidase superfamily)
MDPGYLEYFEASDGVSLSVGSLLRLAEALETTSTALAGGEVDRPPGRGRAGSHPRLEVLSREQCMAHLAQGGVGRIVFAAERGPMALPVNFACTAHEIIFKTDEAMATTVTAQGMVGFEVDRIDDTMSEGWSVVVTGNASRVDAACTVDVDASLPVEPWAGGSRDIAIRIDADEVTGRVIVLAST